MRYQRSSALFQDAQKYIPGGVNSPVRAFKSVGGTPIYIKGAEGPYLEDEDGHTYIDYINSWGPQILGHAYQPVVNAVIDRARRGTSFGTPTEVETEIAKLIVSMVPGIDQIRMVNSGTEACMSAIRLARGFTGKDKIIKFAGCYHGHSDSFLIAAGSGAVTFGAPNSPGVTQGTAKDTLLANYNDMAHVKSIVEEHDGEIAAVIIEPVAGNMGCIPPQSGFLNELRAYTESKGILLIFDEVMTGFRLAPGGAQEVFGITADIVCFGKIIGGGLPVGAFAARHEIMNMLAPLGAVYQAGTLSGNPLAMSAGLAMLSALNEDREIYTRINEKTAYLHKELDAVFSASGHAYTINRYGSMISVHFCDSEVIDFETAKAGDNPKFKAFFHGMLERGVYLAPSAYETWFICDALSYEDIDNTVKRAAETLVTIAK